MMGFMVVFGFEWVFVFVFFFWFFFFVVLLGGVRFSISSFGWVFFFIVVFLVVYVRRGEPI